jgi:hypothetical protein
MAIPSQAGLPSHADPKFAGFPCNESGAGELSRRGGPCSGNRLDKPHGFDAGAVFSLWRGMRLREARL